MTCPLKETCKVEDNCSADYLKKSNGHCFVGNGLTPQEALDKARKIIREG